mgnify:CR=1 FL=1
MHSLGGHCLGRRLERGERAAARLLGSGYGRGGVVHERLQLGGGGRLRPAKVEDLVHELVDQREVLAQRLLVEHANVVLAHLRQLREQLDDKGGRDVVDGGAEEEEAILADADVVDAVDAEDWRQVLLLKHLAQEGLRRLLRHLVAVVLVDNRVAVGCEDEEL